MEPPWWWPEDFWKYTLNNPTGVSLFVVEILLILTFLVHACWMICTIGKYPKRTEDEDLEETSNPQGPAQGLEVPNSTEEPVPESRVCKSRQGRSAEPEEPRSIMQERAFQYEDTKNIWQSHSEGNEFQTIEESASEIEKSKFTAGEPLSRRDTKTTYELVLETEQSKVTNRGPGSQRKESKIIA